MTKSLRNQAAKAIERRILSLIMRDTADDTTVTVEIERRYTVLGRPASESWTGDVAGFAMRMAIALHGNDDQAAVEQKDTHTGSSAPVWAGFTAREEIIGNLLGAGYNEAAAKELVKRADREPHAQPADDEFEATLAGGHALVMEYGDCEFYGSCQCGKSFGMVTPNRFGDDTFGSKWERHVMEVGRG